MVFSYEKVKAPLKYKCLREFVWKVTVDGVWRFTFETKGEAVAFSKWYKARHTSKRKGRGVSK